MASEPIKHFALGRLRCEVADESAVGRDFPKLLDLRQIVLHRPPVSLGENGVSIPIGVGEAPAGVNRRPLSQCFRNGKQLGSFLCWRHYSTPYGAAEWRPQCVSQDA